MFKIRGAINIKPESKTSQRRAGAISEHVNPDSKLTNTLRRIIISESKQPNVVLLVCLQKEIMKNWFHVSRETNCTITKTNQHIPQPVVDVRTRKEMIIETSTVIFGGAVKNYAYLALFTLPFLPCPFYLCVLEKTGIHHACPGRLGVNSAEGTILTCPRDRYFPITCKHWSNLSLSRVNRPRLLLVWQKKTHCDCLGE